MAIRVLVIDDSALMRKYMRSILEEAGFDAETARDGAEGLEKTKALSPDVITLDINMPVMDGLTALSHIMTEWPTPVVMVSSLTKQGELATFEALAMGAVDFVEKPGGTVSVNIKEAGSEIVSKVRSAAEVKLRKPIRQLAGRGSPPLGPTPDRPGRAVSSRGRGPSNRRPAGGADRRREVAARSSDLERGACELVLIGSSTGGPTALERILPRLPAHTPCPILVAQHMPRNFTRVFAERLDGICQMPVIEVGGPTLLERGRIHIARGDGDVLVSVRGGQLLATGVPRGSNSTWSPCVDRMVDSAMNRIAAPRLIAVQLTGMGDDGARAMATLREQGGRTIAESEESAAIFGMPRALIERGGASEVLPGERIAERLQAWVLP